MGDMLGQSKNLGQDSGMRPRDLVYGKPSGKISTTRIIIIFLVIIIVLIID